MITKLQSRCNALSGSLLISILDCTLDQLAYVIVTSSCSHIQGGVSSIIFWVLVLNLVHDEATDVQATIVCGSMKRSVPQKIIFRVLLLNLVHHELTYGQVTFSCSLMEGSVPIASLWVFVLNLVYDEATDVQATFFCSHM